MLGRTSPAGSEAEPNAPPAIVLGYDLWQRTFNGDPSIVGKTLRISRMSTPATVISVMPPGARFLPSPGVLEGPNYKEQSMRSSTSGCRRRRSHGLKDADWDVVGRLRDGVRPADARAGARRPGLAPGGGQPQMLDGFVPIVRPLMADERGDGRKRAPGRLTPITVAGVLMRLMRSVLPTIDGSPLNVRCHRS